MNKINFENLPSTTTPVNASNLNLLQTNAETAILEDNTLAEYGNGTIDPDTTLYPLILSRHTNTPEGASGVFYYIKTIFFNDVSTTSSRTQIAIGYNKDKVWQRYYYSGTWSAWTLVSPSKITTGTEFETGRTIDGKKEYGKRIDCGALPNNTTKTTATGLSNVTYTKIEAISYSSSTVISLPISSPTNINSNIYMAISNNSINIITKTDYSAYTKTYVTVYYTKN